MIPPTLRGSQGHDAAVLTRPLGREVACADQVVLGVHFDSSAHPRQVGRKAALRALHRGCKMPLVHFTLGNVYQETRRHDLAVEAYTRALRPLSVLFATSSTVVPINAFHNNEDQKFGVGL